MSRVTIVSDIAFAPELVAQIEEVLKPYAGRLVTAPGSGGDNTDFETALSEAQAMYATNLTPERFRAAQAMQWVHCPWAGVNGLLTIEDLVKSPVVLTNGSGVIAASVADQVLAFMLGFSRQMPLQYLAQQRGEWGHKELRGKLDELAGKTAGLVGYGRIGSEISRRAKAFGMRVIATRNNPTAPADDLDLALSTEQLPQLLAESDYVIVTVPLTPQTHGMIGAEQFALMKPRAILINIGRGQLIKEQEMIEALQSGRLAGAGLDVFEQEPLPPDSPLWKLPNVLITPHTAGLFQGLVARSVSFFCENLQHYLKGEPLENQVDKERGY